MSDPLDEIYLADSPLSRLPLNVLHDMRHEGIIREYIISSGESLSIPSNSTNDTFFLAFGEIDIVEFSRVTDHLSGKATKRRPVRLSEHDNISFLAKTKSALIRIDQEYLDYYISWKAINQDVSNSPKSVKDILSNMKHPTVFMNIPMENISQVIQKMHIKDVKAGTEVITQGDIADSFYIIASGQAEVWEKGIYNDTEEKVNRLYAGNHFGQDTLIVDGRRRSASVRMIEDSQLLVLNGSDFKELIGKSLIHEIDAEKAKALLDEKDTVLLDVRYEEEWEESRLPGAKLIPLPELRSRLSEIEQQKTYVIYDRNGTRSIIAAMILQQVSVQAFSISGGIVGWPYDIDESSLEK